MFIDLKKYCCNNNKKSYSKFSHFKKISDRLCIEAKNGKGAATTMKTFKNWCNEKWPNTKHVEPKYSES